MLVTPNSGYIVGSTKTSGVDSWDSFPIWNIDQNPHNSKLKGLFWYTTGQRKLFSNQVDGKVNRED